jgi:hypothetical protein
MGVAVPGPARTGGAVAPAGGAAGGAFGLEPPFADTISCTSDLGETLFAAQRFDNQAPATRTLYTWTTNEQAAELRRDGVLLTRSEREGLGPGYAIERLRELSSAGETDTAQLASLLTSERFAKARYAWPHPWATRLGWPGEDYGNQLVQIELRAEAWIAIARRGQVSVIDMSHEPVPTSEVLESPERLAAIFFVKDGGNGGPECGSFFGGPDGYREFLVINESQVERWSLGTTQMRERLLADIQLLELFFERARSNPESASPRDWNAACVCGWDGSRQVDGIAEQCAYEAALSMPSALYLPAPRELTTLIETLRADLFEPDPFSVEPSDG